ncbi:hypothetical protein TraAM80_06418 [Trypanosoma rangeli]|uniref:Uncharacterized protein n=1 Tax=Trypanosoma rangeli TaxID=5698 RepID=A0A3R7MAK0_TRYRA|nr:uncharacterized protein TraAM80_06418 [Trypanosoma rangeli]RNF02386.1 hypothetical protein TraAM80_06418 [Trypanosoma rangeli]|eukprot:RNF02386.1 hypothetical protein TraAM80_06418 [Trypanosoma rangeli]
MSTLLACPYCGLQLGMSSMRAHIALCNSCDPSGDNSEGREKSSEALTRSRNSDVISFFTIQGLPSADTLIPSRSPSDMHTPQVLHLDLRTKSSGKTTAKDAKVTMPLVQLVSKRRYGSRCGSSSLPSFPYHGNDQLLTMYDAVGNGAYSSPLAASSIEKCAGNKGHGECFNGKENRGNLASLEDPQLLERVFRLEAMNKELYEALAVERETHERSMASLERTLTSVQAELSTLHALVAGTAKSAEAAHYGMKDIETRLENVTTREAFRRLEEKLEDLFVWSRTLQQGTRLPQWTVSHDKNDKLTLVNHLVMNTPSDSCEIGRGIDRGRGTGSEGWDSFAGMPFLSKDTGELIAHLLKQQPAAWIHTLGSASASEASTALPGDG